MNEFDYTQIAWLDYFDSRDVVDHIKQINTWLETLELFPREKAELRLERLVLHTLLEKLDEDMPTPFGEPISTDVNCGVSGFAEHYAAEYAEEHAYDTGAVERGSWVESFIDWEKVADSLKEDYTEVRILGSTFYLRD